MMKVLTSLPTSKPTKLAGISPQKKKSRRPTRAGFSSSSEWWQPWELVDVGGGVAVEKAEKSEEFQKQILDST